MFLGLDVPGGPALKSSSQADKPFWHILADVAAFGTPLCLFWLTADFAAEACSSG
jgi:hypothetical protein